MTDGTYMRSFPGLTDSRGDDFTGDSPWLDLPLTGQFLIGSTSGPVNWIWRDLYMVINRANQVIEHIPEYDDSKLFGRCQKTVAGAGLLSSRTGVLQFSHHLQSGAGCIAYSKIQRRFLSAHRYRRSLVEPGVRRFTNCRSEPAHFVCQYQRYRPGTNRKSDQRRSSRSAWQSLFVPERLCKRGCAI